MILFVIFIELAESIINTTWTGHFWEIPEKPFNVVLKSPDDTRALEMYIKSRTGNANSIILYSVSHCHIGALFSSLVLSR